LEELIGSRPLFEPYDVLLLATGFVLLITTLGRDLLDRLNFSKTFLYLAVGLVAGPLLLNLGPEDPFNAIEVFERVSEMGVILSLIVLGIRIGRPISWSGWQSTVRLILIVMPATIFAIALTGQWMFGLAVGPAILLGAILAPTDPILAGPLEEQSPEDESEDRFGLSSEAGLNDGFAFPFVYLGLYATVRLPEWPEWIGYWLLQDLLYAAVLALPLGWFLGILCGRLFIARSRAGGVSNKRLDFIPLALLFAVYGLTEVLGGYGFLAAFTTGLGFRRALSEATEILARFANFTDSVDDLFKAVVLIMLGSFLRWGDFAAVGWPLLIFPLIVIFLIRPALTLLATLGGGFSRIDRVYWGWFGVRGIGSIYYMSYAFGQGVEDSVARTIFAITTATILMSSLFHGVSMRPFLHRFAPGLKVEE
jgi:sodium/hydrogen antiporter